MNYQDLKNDAVWAIGGLEYTGKEKVTERAIDRAKHFMQLMETPQGTWLIQRMLKYTDPIAMHQYVFGLVMIIGKDKKLYVHLSGQLPDSPGLIEYDIIYPKDGYETIDTMMTNILKGIKTHAESLRKQHLSADKLSQANQCFGFDIDGPDFRLIVLTSDYDQATNVLHKVLSIFGAGDKLDLAETNREKMQILAEPEDYNTIAQLYNSGNLGVDFTNTSDGQTIQIGKDLPNRDDQLFATPDYIPETEIIARYMQE